MRNHRAIDKETKQKNGKKGKIFNNKEKPHKKYLILISFCPLAWAQALIYDTIIIIFLH